MSYSFEKELHLARDAAHKAGRIQREFQNNLPETEFKQDHSPVTEVDRRCEKLIRDTLLEVFPRDGFLGEESGSVNSNSGRTWIVDPLDGTRPYLRGIPTYSVLIGLEDGDDMAVGVMHFPALQQTCWAARNQGAYADGAPIHVSKTEKLNTAMGSALGFLDTQHAAGNKLLGLMREWDYVYGFMDAYSYASLAKGGLDCSVNLYDRPWDCAAAACVIAEAGGAYTDREGVQTVHNGSIVFSNGILHEKLLEKLQ